MIHLENEKLSDLRSFKLNRTEKISLMNKEYEKWIFNQIPQKINSRKPNKPPNHVERLQRTAVKPKINLKINAERSRDQKSGYQKKLE